MSVTLCGREPGPVRYMMWSRARPVRYMMWSRARACPLHDVVAVFDVSITLCGRERGLSVT